jgi:hypothetical protein
MSSLLDQAPLIAFLVFYYFYGARLVGTLMAAAFRPIRGLEARPPYWEGGLAMLIVGLCVWTLARRPLELPWLNLLVLGLIGVIAVVMLAAWGGRRIWLEDGVLKSKGLWTALRSLPLEGIRRAQVGGDYTLVLERSDGGPALRAPLAMDGLDGIFAALVRAGVSGLSFEDFQAARKTQRRR